MKAKEQNPLHRFPCSKSAT